jgi:hypothetical protein
MDNTEDSTTYTSTEPTDLSSSSSSVDTTTSESLEQPLTPRTPRSSQPTEPSFPGPETPTSSANSSPATSRAPSRAAPFGDASRRQTKVVFSPRAVFAVKAPITTTHIAEDMGENASLMYSDRETETLKDIFSLFITKQPE